MLNQAAYVVSHHLLGADQYIDGDRFVGEQTLAGQVRRGAYPGNFGRGAKQRMGDLAGDHIDLVAVGDGDQHIGVFTACLTQHNRVGTRPSDGADIEFSVQVAQFFGVGVNDSDVVFLAGEVFSQCAADLAGA